MCYLLLTFERLSETNWNREWERELFGSSCYRSYVLRVNVRAEIVSVWFKEGDRETEEVYFCEWHKEVCAEIYNESVIPNRPDISDDRSRNDNRLNCKWLLWLLYHCANCDRIVFIRGSIPGLYFHYQCDKMFKVNVTQAFLKVATKSSHSRIYLNSNDYKMAHYITQYLGHFLR